MQQSAVERSIAYMVALGGTAFPLACKVVERAGKRTRRNDFQFLGMSSEDVYSGLASIALLGRAREDDKFSEIAQKARTFGRLMVRAKNVDLEGRGGTRNEQRTK